MEFLSGIFAGVFGFIMWWPILIALFCFTLWVTEESLKPDRDFQWMAMFLNMFMLSSVYITFGVTFEYFHILAYMVIGLLWSFLRFDRYGQHVRDNFDKKGDRAYWLRLDKNTGAIANWILIWPFSIMRWLLEDIIHMVEKLITVYFRGVYTRIADKYIGE